MRRLPRWNDLADTLYLVFLCGKNELHLPKKNSLELDYHPLTLRQFSQNKKLGGQVAIRTSGKQFGHKLAITEAQGYISFSLYTYPLCKASLWGGILVQHFVNEIATFRKLPLVRFSPSLPLVRLPLVRDNNDFCANQLKVTHKKKFIWTVDEFDDRPEHTDSEDNLIGPGIFGMSAPDCGSHKLEWRIFICTVIDTIEEESNEFDYNLDEYGNRIPPARTMRRGPSHFDIRLDLTKFSKQQQFAKAIFSIRDCEGKEWFKEETNLQRIDKRATFNVSEFVKWDLLMNQYSEKLLPDGRLTIVFWIHFIKEEIVKRQLPDVLIPENRVLEEMGKMFEESQFTDCSIFAKGGKEFKVHKCILASRCPVFDAMFKHQMSEAQSNSIRIEDISPEVMKEFLRFIYNGTPGNIENVAGELLIAAEKYNLERLKAICEHSLARSLEVDNACDRLVLADLHSAEQLKSHAIIFCKKYLVEVKQSKGWKLLNEEQRKMIEGPDESDSE